MSDFALFIGFCTVVCVGMYVLLYLLLRKL